MALYHPAFRETILASITRLLQPSFPTRILSRLPSLRPTNQSVLSISIPAISLNIPNLISDIWEGILRAAPKKKTSHRKRRQRLLAGKGLKDVKALVKCPACGRPKRAHYLCPFCVAGGCRSSLLLQWHWQRIEIKESWKTVDWETVAEKERKRALSKTWFSGWKIQISCFKSSALASGVGYCIDTKGRWWRYHHMHCTTEE